MLIRRHHLACLLALAVVSFAGAAARAADPHIVLTADESELFRRVNVERAKVGAAPLKLQPQLMLAARGHADAMFRAGQLSHTIDGVMADRIRAQGLDKFGSSNEILSTGKVAETAIALWLQSPAHSRAMLLTTHTYVGVSVSNPNAMGQRYWTCLLISSTDPVGARGTVEIPGQAAPEVAPNPPAVLPTFEPFQFFLGITNSTPVVLKVYKLGSGMPELLGTLQSGDHSSFSLPVGAQVVIKRTDTRTKVQSVTVGEENSSIEIRF